MPAQEAQPPTLIVDRIVRHHEEINQLVDVGYPLSEIARRFGLDRRAVRRYRNTSFDVLLASARDHRNVPFDRFKPYPQAEFAARNTVVPYLLPARSPGASCDHVRTSHREKRTPPSADSHPTVVPTLVPKLSSGCAEIHCAASRLPSTAGRDRPPTAGRALRPSAPRG